MVVARAYLRRKRSDRSPPGINAEALLAQVVARHGGMRRWASVDRIDARLSAGGLAFLSRWQACALIRRQVSMFPHQRRVLLAPFFDVGSVGEWTPDAVRVHRADRADVEQRMAPRARFDHWRSHIWWDRMDVLYFAGYALWNYLSFPFLLDDASVVLHPDVTRSPSGDRVLSVQFPEAYPTHCRHQRFHVDAEGCLVRHDYVAEVFGSWAAAANFCEVAQEHCGLRFYTRRRVLPSSAVCLALRFPTLVWIELDELVVHEAANGNDAALFGGWV